MQSEDLEFLFHPASIAVVGVTTANPEHWTRSLLDGLLEFGFDRPLYLVNPKGGEIKGHRVYASLGDVPGPVEYVIGLVPARAAPRLVEEAAAKGARAIHFCTAGFSEVAEEEGTRLEAEVVALARRHHIRIIGPNCMGIYSPESHMSFSALFPRESGPVGVISQSGGNSNYLVKLGAVRGIRFSKLVSYGNAADLNECDFLEHLASDPETRLIAMYVEGVRDGPRFRRALEKAAAKKTLVLLKGGLTEAGARAAQGHTASLAGSEATWDALCKQLGIIRVDNMDEMIDVLVTLLFLPLPVGRNAVLVGGGGGASVVITDAFEKRGLKVPPLSAEVMAEIRAFTPIAGNILRNPVDYGQTLFDPASVRRTMAILSAWPGTDFLVKFVRIGQSPLPPGVGDMLSIDAVLLNDRSATKPVAVVLEPTVFPNESPGVFSLLQGCAAAGLPVYYSFESAALAIDRVLKHFGR